MLLNAIKNSLNASPRCYDAVKALSRMLGKRSGFYNGLSAAIAPLGSFTFLQIGANDGLSNDPYREFAIRSNARGVAMEPVPEYFAKLKANYSSYPQVRCLNAAVSYGSDSPVMYAYTPEYLANFGGSPELAGLATFSRDKLVALMHPGYDPDTCIQPIRVNAGTVEQILRESGLKHFDCIFLDCEGHEENIISHLDFSFVQPRVIAYEHTHFATGECPIEARLKSLGFSIQRFEYDALAVRRN